MGILYTLLGSACGGCFLLSAGLFLLANAKLAMDFSKQLTKSSLAHIGKHCGNKDHATVLHACKTVNNLADTDKRFKGYISDIEKRLIHS